MSEHRFDPAVVALLDELARSSTSGLLRVPKERLLRWVGREGDVLTPHGTWQSAAERHLVAAYREQAAAVLYGACIEQLAKPDSQLFVEESARTDRRMLEQRASRLVQASVRVGDERALDVLRGYREADASQLAAASLRLVPSDPARIALGLAFFAEGHGGSAMQAFSGVLSGRPTALNRSAAHDNRAMIHGSRSDFSRALACCVESVRAAPGQWKAWAWRMIAALQLGDDQDALRSASEMAKLGAPTASLDQLVAFLREGRAKGKWEPTVRSLAIAPRLADRLPENTRGICHAFQ